MHEFCKLLHSYRWTPTQKQTFATAGLVMNTQKGGSIGGLSPVFSCVYVRVPYKWHILHSKYLRVLVYISSPYRVLKYDCC